MALNRLNFAAIIKERVSSREMIESVGIHIDSRGMAKCPFHGDGDASLKIYREQRRGWHCYGCQAGGDVTDFAMRWYGLDFKGAIARINADFALSLPLDDRPSPEEERRIREDMRRRKQEQEKKKAACEAAEAAYWQAFERWLTNEQTIRFDRPRGPQEPMSEGFIYAVTHRAEIRDILDMAEERRWAARAGQCRRAARNTK